MSLSDQLAELWRANPPAKLPPLPKPLGCDLDHRSPANWKLTNDRHARTGFRRASCKQCDRFWGYVDELNLGL